MFWCDFIAGWIGGSAGIAVGHPFDTLKVRQQSPNGGGGGGGAVTLWAAARDCGKYEGLHGFFKGLSYPLLSAGALNSLFFGFYGVALRAVEGRDHHTNAADGAERRPAMWSVFWAGCAGGVAQLSVACPVDLVKIKLQTETADDPVKRRYKGPYDVLRKVYARRGVAGWYQGLHVMAWRDCPAFGLYVILYEGVMDWCGSSSHSCRFLAGGLAGVLSWTSIIPLDVIKSRIQSDDPVNPRYRGTLDCARQIRQECGWRVFARGLPAVWIRAFPLNGATFVVYEHILEMCRGEKDLREY